jgi:hypothetical protein
MNASLRKSLLGSHVVFSIAWIGAVAAFLVLAVVGRGDADALTVRACYVAMELIAWYIIVPLSFLSPLTGIVQALVTPWGLFRHYWVLLKFTITLPSTAFLLVHMEPIGQLADLAAARGLSTTDLEGLRLQLTVDAIAALIVLLVATALAVYKPRGLTPFAVRREATRGVAASALPSRAIWGRYALLGFAGLAILFIAVHLGGGGMHGH